MTLKRRELEPFPGRIGMLVHHLPHEAFTRIPRIGCVLALEAGHLLAERFATKSATSPSWNRRNATRCPASSVKAPSGMRPPPVLAVAMAHGAYPERTDRLGSLG